MPPLREIEAAVGRTLLGVVDPVALDEVVGDGLARGARLQIYRHHVFTTLTAALRTTYSVVCQLVDERFFGYAAEHYIQCYPPRTPCLVEYGASFPEFLAAFDPCRPLEYLPDVARLEWALNVALHADEAEPLDLARLQSLPEDMLPMLRLRFDPSVTLLSSRWPIDRIVRANQPGADPGIVVDLAVGGVYLEVRRLGEDAVFRALERATYAFRHALIDGHSLEEAAVAALALDASFDLVAACQSLFAERLLTDDIVTSDLLRESP